MMTKSEQRALADALHAAEELCSRSLDSTCAVEPEHKEAVRGYVQAWIVPYIRMALEHGVTGESGTLRVVYRNGEGACNTMGANRLLGEMQMRRAKKGG